MKIPYRNHTIFAGFIGNDVVIRTLPSSDVCVSLRVCAQLPFKSNGEWHSVPEWATAVFYRNQAEDLIKQGVKRGDFIHLEGRRHTRVFNPDPGSRREASVPEIIVANWHLVDLRREAPAQLPRDEPAAESRADDSGLAAFRALA